jgi:hypothetical protein
VRAQIGEAAERRHTAPIASLTLWAVLCGIAVIVLHSLTAGFGPRMGSYRSGIVTVAMFVLAASYFPRKHSMWFSVRWLRLVMRLPRPLALRLVLIDRLETWRTVHITLGIFVLLPFWWHTDSGPASNLETVLKLLLVTLVISGIAGTIIEEYLPVEMRKRPDQEVRLSDVEQRVHALYVEAEEKILGHSEGLVRAYLRGVRPILTGNQPSFKMLWATLVNADPAPAACAPARLEGAALGADGEIYSELVDLAEDKVRLEHNHFNLRLNSSWLRVHRGLVATTIVLVVFHILGALYFAGL